MLEVTGLEDVDELVVLRAAADRRRSAGRSPMPVVDHGHQSTEAVELREVLRDVTAGWADLIRQAAAAEQPLADVARAAGVAAPSLYYRLRRPVLEQPGQEVEAGDRGAVQLRWPRGHDAKGPGKAQCPA